MGLLCLFLTRILSERETSGRGRLAASVGPPRSVRENLPLLYQTGNLKKAAFQPRHAVVSAENLTENSPVTLFPFGQPAGLRRASAQVPAPVRLRPSVTLTARLSSDECSVSFG